MQDARHGTAERAPSLWKGALAGLAAGLVAAAAMNAFQSAVEAAAPPGDEDAPEPATVKAADRMSRAATGARVPDDARAAAGAAVHYLLGGALGVGYGIAAEYLPEVTRGFGTAFGGAVETVLDQGAVPAAGLAAPPTQTPAATHLLGLGSHIVFGGVAEGVRRVTRAALR